MYGKIVALSLLAVSTFSAPLTIECAGFTHVFSTGDQIHIAPFTVELDPEGAAYVPITLGVGSDATTQYVGLFEVVEVPIVVAAEPVVWRARIYYTSAGSTFKIGIGNGLNGAYPIDAPVQSANLPLGHVDPIPITVPVPLANLPEPSTWLLVGSALCAVSLLRKR